MIFAPIERCSFLFFILPTYSATMEDFSWFNFNFLCLKINLKKNKDASSKGLNNENKKMKTKNILNSKIKAFFIFLFKRFHIL